MITDSDVKKIMAVAGNAEKRRIEQMRFATACLVDDVVVFEKIEAKSTAAAQAA